MCYYKKNSDYTYRINIHVKPNSRIQDIKAENEFLVIQLKSKPLQNKANKELISLLKKKLKIPSNLISIISGHKSTDKVVEITFNEEIKGEDLNELLFR